MQGFIKTIINAIQAWTKKEIKKNVNITLPTPDWNENDPNADGYIENRTHWEEINSDILVPPTTVIIGRDLFVEEAIDVKLITGQLYNIVWEEKEYQCVCYDYDECPVIGNNACLGGNNGNGEPFLISNYDGLTAINVYTPGTYTISVFTLETIIHKLDPKFISLPEFSSIGKEGTSIGAEIFNSYENNIASGDNSHAEGDRTTASGESSHAEGWYTEAVGDYSHAEGYGSIAIGIASHAESYATAFNLNITGQANATSYTTDRALGTVGEGGGYAVYNGVVAKVKTLPLHSRNLQLETTLSSSALNNAQITIYIGAAIGDYSHTEGNRSSAGGDYSHAEGRFSDAIGNNSHAEGYSTNAVGENSHAEGQSTTASGQNSHAEGYYTKASGKNAHAEGGTIPAHGDPSAYPVRASGDSSHAEGSCTEASGSYSHAEGGCTRATAPGSHAEGYNTVAFGNFSHVQGIFNIPDSSPDDEDYMRRYAHIVGNGTSDTKRSNAHTLDWDGNAWFAGDVFVGGAGQDDGEVLAKMSEVIPIPTTAAVGQTIAVKAVDENGKPTEWEAVKMADPEWKVIKTLTLTEDAETVVIDMDDNGNPFSLRECIMYIEAKATASAPIEYIPNGYWTAGNYTPSAQTTATDYPYKFAIHCYGKTGEYFWGHEIMSKSQPSGNSYRMHTENGTVKKAPITSFKLTGKFATGAVFVLYGKESSE